MEQIDIITVAFLFLGLLAIALGVDMTQEKIYGAVIVMLLIIAVICFGYVWIKKDKDHD
jgi:hypothetical protein